MFKFKQILAAVGVLLTSTLVAQPLPDHDLYIDFGIQDRSELVDAIINWEPGDNLSTDPNYVDENFFISRIPLKDKFDNANCRANTTANADRKMNWWMPIGEPTKTWQALPRYNFQADNFNMWQYVDIHGNWSSSWFRVPASFSDVAHKNGVTTGCLYFIDWAASVTEYSEAGRMLARLAEKNAEGKYKNARKLIQFLKYYGIEGIGLNPEGNWTQSLTDNFSGFLAECHRMAEEENWPFRVDWYSMVTNSGRLTSGTVLSSTFDKWFDQDGTPVTDVFFLNYPWSINGLKNSCTYAENLGRSCYDVYCGFLQGREESAYKWQQLTEYSKGSICMWGGHAASNLFVSSNEVSSSDLGVETEYQTKQELLFTNGKRNVLADVPVPSRKSNKYTDLKKWHGYSKLLTAKSVLSELPFVTRFNLGNGMFFKKEGQMAFNHKWYNISMQDLLPTWRWWIDNGDGKTIPSDAIQCDFTFDDAWFGGSCLKIHGATSQSDVHLFKTKFTVESVDDAFSITYKANQTDAKMRLMVSKEGAESTFKYLPIEIENEVANGWNTMTLKASDLDLEINDVIACIGLSFTDTPDNYELLLGEFSLIPNSFSKQPVTPVITHAIPLKRTYKSADFKVIFDVPFTGQRKAAYDGCPIYNEEVNTSYFEIYFKQEGTTPRLITTTTSWAAYAVDVPIEDITKESFYVGVRAVGLDGKTASPIVWSDPITTEATIFNNIVVSKPIIKPNQKFNISFEDPLHEAAIFKIYNAAGEVVFFTPSAVTKAEIELSEVGVYDVEIIEGENSVISRGMIDVTPESVGRMPEIVSITADETAVAKNKTVQLTADVDEGVSYNTKSCKVSQGLHLTAERQFKVNSNIINSPNACSFAMWFKPDEFKHSTYGTVLMTKVNRNDPGSWTRHVWGEMLTAIRPSDFGETGSMKNSISVMFDYPIGGTPNLNHNTAYDGMAKDYELQKEKWYHICVVKDNGKVKLYLNGVKKFEESIKYSSTWSNANFYVGGNIFDCGYFIGTIDEVQVWNKSLTDTEVAKSMKGFRIAPSGLQGYFTFEKVETDEESNLYFPNKGKNSTAVKGGYVTFCNAPKEAVLEEPIRNDFKVVAGVPFMSGSLDVEFKSAKWLLEGANITSSDKNAATAVYTKVGKHPVTLTLTNTWGTTTRTIKDYITVGNDGIDEETEENLSIYPNPFVNEANILFTNQGAYNVKVYDVQGREILVTQCNVTANEVRQLNIEGAAGLYYVVIMKNHKCVRSFKVIKK